MEYGLIVGEQNTMQENIAAEMYKLYKIKTLMFNFFNK